MLESCPSVESGEWEEERLLPVPLSIGIVCSSSLSQDLDRDIVLSLTQIADTEDFKPKAQLSAIPDNFIPSLCPVSLGFGMSLIGF